jgi:hypothetical protein
MSRLEDRYRRVLRLLPAGYRQVWQEDMVAAFLASTATGDPETDEYLADYGRPGLAEVASVAALAARLRLGADAPARRDVWGRAVRLAVLLATLTNAVMSTGGVTVTAWLTGALGWPPVPAGWALPPQHPGLPAVLATVAGYAWLPAYLALLLGHRRAAQAVALVAVVTAAGGSLATAVSSLSESQPLSVSVSPWAYRLIEVVVVLGMAAFRPGDPPAHRRRWLAALPVGVALVAVPLSLLQFGYPPLRAADWPDTLALLATAGAAGYLLAALTGRVRHTPDRTLAALLLAAGAFLLRLATLPDNVLSSPPAERGAQLVAGCAALVALLAVGLPLLTATRNTWRHLPAPRAERVPGRP